MELDLAVLKFDGTHTAANALAKARAESAPPPFLEEVAVVERHKSGRVSIGGTYAGYYGESEEGEDVAGGIALGSLTGGLIGLIGGPVGFVVGLVGGGAVGGAIGAAAEEDAGTAAVYDRIKQELPKGSSALILLAASPTVDDLFAAFAAHNAEQVREAMTDEEVERLRAAVS